MQVRMRPPRVVVPQQSLSDVADLLQVLFPDVAPASVQEFHFRRQADGSVTARIEHTKSITLAEAQAARDAGEEFSVIIWQE